MFCPVVMSLLYPALPCQDFYSKECWRHHPLPYVDYVESKVCCWRGFVLHAHMYEYRPTNPYPGVPGPACLPSITLQ